MTQVLEPGRIDTEPGRPRRSRWWLAAVLAVVALAVGVAGGWLLRGGSQDTAETVTPAPSTTLAPAAPSAPVTLGASTLVAGTATCDEQNGTVTFDSNEVSHSRNGGQTCTMASNDPRVAGQYVATWNSDRWGTLVSGMGITQWGTVRLENAQGAWEGRYAGAMTSKTGDSIMYWFTGTGAYAGLSYCMWVFEPQISGGSTSGTTTWPTHGLVFPGNPPTP